MYEINWSELSDFWTTRKQKHKSTQSKWLFLYPNHDKIISNMQKSNKTTKTFNSIENIITYIDCQRETPTPNGHLFLLQDAVKKVAKVVKKNHKKKPSETNKTMNKLSELSIDIN
eukprot:75409_1